jgi:peptide/nickel transport system substrate-binding protein
MSIMSKSSLKSVGMKARLVTASLFVLATVGIVGTAGASNSSSSIPLKHPSKTLVYAISAFAIDFDPASSYLLAEGILWGNTYQGLVTYAPGSITETVGQLATSWQENPTKTEWTFHLRPNVKFTDGTPLTADVVKENFVRTITIGLGTQSILGTYLPKPQSQIVVVNPLTVEFKFPHPVAYFDRILAAEWGTQIVSPKVFTEHSTGPKDQGHEWLQTHAAPGTGPYEVQSIQPNNQVVLVRNPSYWGGWKGWHFNKVIIEDTSSISALREDIQTGNADITQAGTPEDTLTLKKTPGIVVSQEPAIENEYIILGDYGVLKNPDARLALEYAFPYKDWVSDIMKNTVEPMHGDFPSGLFTADPNISVPTNLTKAKKLFAEAGIKSGTTLTYDYSSEEGGDEQGLVLQAQLAKIGITLKITDLSASAYISALTTKRPVDRRADMYWWAWDPDYNDPADNINPTLSSSQTPTICPCFNSGYYINKTVQSFINAGFSGSLTTAQYTALSDKVQKILAYTDPPWISTDQEEEILYLRSDIKGYVANPLYILFPNYYALSRSS